MSLIPALSALESNPSPVALAKLARIRVILEEPEQIPGATTQLLAEMACDGYVNSELKTRGDELFPGLDPNADCSKVRPVDLERDYNFSEIDGILNGMGLKAVRPDKAMRWAAKNRDAHHVGWYLASGQTGRYSDGDDVALVLNGDAGGRRANLRGVQDKWRRYCHVLAEPKE